jgi:hypothetical protein
MLKSGGTCPYEGYIIGAGGAVPAGERPNKTHVFVTGVTDTRGFLAWLRTSCPSSLSALMKGEKLMIVPGTADGFRATVSALRSLGGSNGETFHTFSQRIAMYV